MQQYNKGDKVKWTTIFEGGICFCSGEVTSASGFPGQPQFLSLIGHTVTGVKITDKTYSDDKSLEKI